MNGLRAALLRILALTRKELLAVLKDRRARMSAATSLYTAAQQLATTVGISVGALALHVSMFASDHATPETSDFSLAFLVVAFVTLVAAPIALGMPRNAGDDLTGRRSA